MAHSFKDLMNTTRSNGVTKDFMRLWHKGAWWDEGLEQHLWEECWRRKKKIKFLPDYYYDKGRFQLWTDTDRVIGNLDDFADYWRHYPTIEKTKRNLTK